MHDLPAYIVDAVSAPAAALGRIDVPASDDGRSSAPATSIHSSLSRVTTGGETGVSSSGATSPQLEDPKRRRRTSLPHFGFGSPPIQKEARDEKESQEGGARDRLKGFFRSAHQSITAALPSSPSMSTLAASSLLQPPLSPTLLQTAGGSGASSSHAASTGSRENHPVSPRPSVPRSNSSSRRKEGFLYATETSQRHTQSGDGGARYQRFWVVLEDHLTEYDKWTDAMQVHGSPINLRYATARISQQAGERRFAFEVLTPEWRRVYQASSDAECRAWVEAIQARVESLLNGCVRLTKVSCCSVCSADTRILTAPPRFATSTRPDYKPRHCRLHSTILDSRPRRARLRRNLDCPTSFSDARPQVTRGKCRGTSTSGRSAGLIRSRSRRSRSARNSATFLCLTSRGAAKCLRIPRATSTGMRRNRL